MHKLWWPGPGDDLQLDRIDLLKVDTQGSETAVLQGLAGTLGRSAGVRALVEFWPAGLRRAGSDGRGFAAALLPLLDAAGQQLYRIDHEAERLLPLDVDELDGLGRALDVGGGFCNLFVGRPPL